MYYLVLGHNKAMVCKSPSRVYLEMILRDMAPEKRKQYQIVYNKD